MDVVFKGFQSMVPVWLFCLLFIGATAIAWWAYRKVHLSPAYKYTLISLRSAVFLILFILLATPFFLSTNASLVKPDVLVFLDNSASTAIQKGNYKGVETYRSVLDELAFSDHPDIQFHFFAVDDSVHSQPPDSLTMQAGQTNLSSIVQPIRKIERAKTAILITDGIFTRGSNPVFQLTSSDIPVQTIALGDSSEQKDIFIKNVVANDTGSLNTTQDVNVTVVQHGFGGQNFQVQLKSNGEIRDAKTISMAETSASETITFRLNHTRAGLQQFQIAIPPLVEEWTAKNNTRSFSVDVLDNKQHILSLAFEIHPDVRLIRSLLAEDQNTALISRTWLGGNRFVEGAFTFAADSLDLIIMQGYPKTGLPASIKTNLARYLQKVPLMVMATPNISYEQLEAATTISLPISSTAQAQLSKVIPVASVQPTAHPIMDLPEVTPNSLSPLFAPLEALKLNPGSEMLFASQFEGETTASPLLAVQQIGNLRRAQFAAFNWYKMNQTDNQQTRAFVEQLLLNTVSWTATKPDNRNLVIKPSKQTFENSESVILNGFLTDERGLKESEAQVEVKVSGKDISPKNYSMQPSGDGQYHLTLNPLPEGIYAFAAVAKKGERTIGQYDGQFSVTASNTEFINTRQNIDLLKGIAQKTGGTFYKDGEVANLWKDLENKQLLKKEERVEETLFYPHQHLFWFIIIILLLGAEWSIRKYVALP